MTYVRYSLPFAQQDVWVGMMPGGLDRPSCPGERERERERERRERERESERAREREREKHWMSPTRFFTPLIPIQTIGCALFYARGLDRSLMPGREGERERETVDEHVFAPRAPAFAESSVLVKSEPIHSEQWMGQRTRAGRRDCLRPSPRAKQSKERLLLHSRLFAVVSHSTEPNSETQRSRPEQSPKAGGRSDEARGRGFRGIDKSRPVPDPHGESHTRLWIQCASVRGGGPCPSFGCRLDPTTSARTRAGGFALLDCVEKETATPYLIGSLGPWLVPSNHTLGEGGTSGMLSV